MIMIQQNQAFHYTHYFRLTMNLYYLEVHGLTYTYGILHDWKLQSI